MRQFFEKKKKNGVLDTKFVGIISYSPMRYFRIQIVHYFEARG